MYRPNAIVSSFMGYARHYMIIGLSVYTNTYYNIQVLMAIGNAAGENIISAVTGGSRRGNPAIAIAHIQSYMSG